MQTVSRRTGEPAKRYKTQCDYFLQMKPPFVRVGIKRDFLPLNFGTGLCRMHKRNRQK
jgi:hypothetical protein